MGTIVKIIDKFTGEEKQAVYGAFSSSGNMRYHVDGKPLSDKRFNSRYRIKQEETTACEQEDDSLVWRVNTPQLMKEILECNPGMAILRSPLNIFKQVLAEVAEHAIRINDPELNFLMCRLALYSQGDPYDPDYNLDVYKEAMKRAAEAKTERLKNKKP